MTNREKFIKSLSDEEFAVMFCRMHGCDDCPVGEDGKRCCTIGEIIDWLNSECKEDQQT